jgi:hypothetical protein
MASFQLCYNLHKHTSDWDSILGLHPASWAVAVIEPLVQVNICGIVNSDVGLFSSKRHSWQIVVVNLVTQCVRNYIYLS